MIRLYYIISKNYKYLAIKSENFNDSIFVKLIIIIIIIMACIQV